MDHEKIPLVKRHAYLLFRENATTLNVENNHEQRSRSHIKLEKESSFPFQGNQYTKKSLIFKWLNMCYKIKYISFIIIMKI